MVPINIQNFVFKDNAKFYAGVGVRTLNTLLIHLEKCEFLTTKPLD